MKIRAYAIVVAFLVVAAIILRQYAPKDQGVAYLASPRALRRIPKYRRFLTAHRGSNRGRGLRMF